MISLNVNNTEKKFSRKIFSLIPNFNKNVEISDEIFEIFKKWFEILESEREIFEYYSLNEVLDYKYTVGVVFKTEFFFKFNLKTLIDLFNFGISYKIELLSETVAYAISFKNVYYKTVDNKIYAVDLSSEDFSKYLIDRELLTMILNNMSDERFELQPVEIKHLVKRLRKILYEYHPSLFDSGSFILDIDYIEVVNSFKEADAFKKYYKDYFRNIKAKNIFIGYVVKRLHTSVFNELDDIVNINIPNTVEKIKGYYLTDCPNLKSINIPFIREDLFSDLIVNNCPKLNFVYNNVIYNLSDGITLDKIPSQATEINKCCKLPESLKNCLIEKNNCILKFKDTLSEYTIPENILKISATAFNYCSELVEINLSNVIELGDFAFSSCCKLTSITIPDTVTHIGKNCFEKCYTLERFELSSNVKIIPESCFYYCSNLTTINIKNVSMINFSAFDKCSNLVNILSRGRLTDEGYIKLSDVTLDAGIFSRCTKLIEIDLSECDLNDIVGYNTFSECDNVTKIILPNNISKIDSNSFTGCSKLKIISFKDLPDNCFSKSLKSINFAAFHGCKSFNNITLPKEVTQISDSAFKNCEGLEHINTYERVDTLPNISLINEWTYVNCPKLLSINVPSTVTKFEKFSHAKCSTKFNFENPNVKISEHL